MNNSKTLSIIIKARDEASATIQKVAGEVDKSSAQIARAAKTAAVAGAALAVAIGVNAVKAAGDYQSSLSKLSQASGATGDEMTRMSSLARQLGKDTSLAGVTASDAAATMLELSKAGLSVKDTMDATRGVMSLAKAGQMEFSDAAVLAASALNAFGLEGKDAVKVADMLAAGANASQANLSDLGEGLQQSATVAKQFGLNMNETVTALSLFANNGIKGSDAGTSLKTMLIALAKPTDKASELMKEIGFNAYDAQGKFVGLREMSARLAKSTSKLTDEQKQSTLATIFGTDAFRAAAVLAGNTGESYDKMSASVGKVGAAQAAANAQLGGFQKAMEGLSNTASDIALEIGTFLLPAVTNIANVISANALPAFRGMLGVLQGQVPLLTLAGVSMAVYAAATGAVTLATGAWTVAQNLLNAAMKANPYILLASLAAGIVTAYAGVLSQTDANKNATDRLNAARAAQVTANDNAKAAEDRLRGAHLSAEGAALNVERAQLNYNNAVNQYGPKSLEAREAAYQLKRAQDDQSNSVTALRDRTNEARDAQNKLAAAKNNVIQANNEVAGSANSAAGSFAAMARAAGDARQKSEGAVLSAQEASKYGLAGQQEAFKIGGKRASGGPVSAGTPYIVGENEPELFVPNSSGRILNQEQMREAGISGGTTFQFNAPITFSTAESVSRFFELNNSREEFGNYGVGI